MSGGTLEATTLAGNTIGIGNNIGGSNIIGSSNVIGDEGIFSDYVAVNEDGSVSGTIDSQMPFRDTAIKRVIIYADALLGTATYTFPTAFSHTPAIVTTNGPASSVVTSLSTTAVTITGATTTGWIILEGF